VLSTSKPRSARIDYGKINAANKPRYKALELHVKNRSLFQRESSEDLLMPGGTLSDQVTEFVFKYIRDNQLKTGDTLPSEMRTSTELRISRGIVREAFRALRAAGIIEVRNGRPPKVGVLSNSFLTHLLLHALSTKQVLPTEVLDLRAAIEVRAAELAAQRSSDGMIKELRTSVRGMMKSIGNPSNFVMWDVRFHEVINGATGNLLVEVIGGAMHECMAESMLAGLKRRTSRSEIVEIVETHSGIVDAIEKRSSSKAGTLMKKHFVDAKNVLQSRNVDELNSNS
jgi:GntR family transcriptional repressor for pyruvate dehydrogenase complex